MAYSIFHWTVPLKNGCVSLCDFIISLCILNYHIDAATLSDIVGEVSEISTELQNLTMFACP